MKAVILSGGEGKRLKALSLSTPKPMMKILDKPTVSYTMKLLKDHNIKEALFLLSYQSGSVEKYIKKEKAWDISSQFLYEDKPLGTAGCLKNIMGDFSFLVIFGDLVTDFNLTKLMGFHREHKPLITLGKTPAVENTGIFIMEREALSFIPDDTPFDFYNGLVPLLLKREEKILSYYNDCSFYDIDTPKDYKNCSKDILMKEISLAEPKRLKGKNVIIGDNSHLEIGATINPPVYIGKNVYVEAGAEIGAFSVIGNNCKIYSNSHTEDSVIMANSLISDDSVLQSTLISENTKIKRGVHIWENTVIGENCIIGENNVIKPNVNIWPEKITEDNRTICESIINTESSSKPLFSSDGISGELDIEITVPLLCRLGITISNVFKGAKFLFACDGTPPSFMAKTAIISSVMEGGGRIWDIGRELICVFREALSYLNCDIGVYVSLDENKIKIQLTDSYGVKISKANENKIDALYKSGDFFSAGIKNLKPVSVVNNISRYYYKKVIADLEKSDKRRILYYKTSHKMTEDYINEVAPFCGVTPIKIKDKIYTGGEITAEFIKNGEEVNLYNEDGVKLDSNQLFMVAVILLKDADVKKIVVPPYMKDFYFLYDINGVSFIHEDSKESFLKRIKKDSLNLQHLLFSDGIFFVLRLFNYLERKNLLLKDLNF